MYEMQKTKKELNEKIDKWRPPPKKWSFGVTEILSSSPHSLSFSLYFPLSLYLRCLAGRRLSDNRGILIRHYK
jgi:hypothetical protein